MAAVDKGFEDIGSAVRRFLESSPLAKGLGQQEVALRWPTIVGGPIAANSRVESLHEGTLTVQVDGAVWAQELSLLKPRLLEALAVELGEGVVRDLRIHSQSRRGPSGAGN